MQSEGKSIARNKKAWHDYFIEETYEAGISLAGTEVKSIRKGSVNLKDCYCLIKNNEAFVLNMHISPYEQGNIFNKDPLRTRKLLLHKKEILKLASLSDREGYSLIPLSLYFKKGRIKLELGVCKGKKLYDKRQDLKEKAAARDIEQHMKANKQRF